LVKKALGNAAQVLQRENVRLNNLILEFSAITKVNLTNLVDMKTTIIPAFNLLRAGLDALKTRINRNVIQLQSGKVGEFLNLYERNEGSTFKKYVLFYTSTTKTLEKMLSFKKPTIDSISSVLCIQKNDGGPLFLVSQISEHGKYGSVVRKEKEIVKSIYDTF
jgi:hypothetical protein